MARTTTPQQTKQAVYRTARALVSDGQPAEALVLIDDYLPQYDPQEIDLLILKGNILDMMLEHERAARLYRDVLRLDPEHPLALIDLGDFYAKYQAKYRQALPYYDRALQAIVSGRFRWDKAEEYIDACTGKASALMELNKPLEALQCVVEGLRHYPTDTSLAGVIQSAQERYHANQEQRATKRRLTTKVRQQSVGSCPRKKG